MKRKLVKQGAATLMVSLPAKWLKKYNLNKGSEVDIEEAENKLILSSEKITTKSETTIKLTNITESSIRTLITNTYRKGYDKIRVYYKNNEQFKLLQKTIKTRLIGFDIIKKEKDYCIVENITEPSAEQFEQILQKIFYNITSLFETTKKRLNKEKNFEDYEEIEERIQKYDNFCRRVISKQKISIPSELMWTFLTLLIHGQREIYHLNKIPVSQEYSDNLRELLEHCFKIFKMIEEAYAKKDRDILAKIHELEKEIVYKKGYSLLQNVKETKIVYHIISSARQFYLSASPLGGLLLE